MGKRMDVPPCPLDLGKAGIGMCQLGLTLLPSLSFLLHHRNSASYKEAWWLSAGSRKQLCLAVPCPSEFAFWDMPDAGQRLSAQDKPLSVLKQGTVTGWGMVRWWAVDRSAPRSGVPFKRADSPEIPWKTSGTGRWCSSQFWFSAGPTLECLGNLWSWMVRFKKRAVGGWGRARVQGPSIFFHLNHGSLTLTTKKS